MVASWVAIACLVTLVLFLTILLEYDLYRRRKKIWPAGPIPLSERGFLTNPGRFTIYLGVAHTLAVGLLDPDIRLPYIQLFKDGFVGGVQPQEYHKEMVIWFHVTGLVMLLLGYLASRYRLDTQRPPPAVFGGVLLVIGLAGVLAMPSSGFWLVIFNAVWIIILDYTWKPPKGHRSATANHISPSPRLSRHK